MDRRRWIAAAAVAAVLALGACDPDGGGGPSPSATSGSSSAAESAGTSPSPTSTEVPIREQMRRDKEAVKQAYIAGFDELNRLDMAGGATKPTKILRRNNSGDFLRGTMYALRQHKRNGVRLTEPGRLRGFALGPWTSSKIRITACEDYSQSQWVNSKGKVVLDGKDEKYIQEAVALKGADGRWRIDSTTTTRVENFKAASCNTGGV